MWFVSNQHFFQLAWKKLRSWVFLSNKVEPKLAAAKYESLSQSEPTLEGSLASLNYPVLWSIGKLDKVMTIFSFEKYAYIVVLVTGIGAIYSTPVFNCAKFVFILFFSSFSPSLIVRIHIHLLWYFLFRPRSLHLVRCIHRVTTRTDWRRSILLSSEMYS